MRVTRSRPAIDLDQPLHDLVTQVMILVAHAPHLRGVESRHLAVHDSAGSGGSLAHLRCGP